MWSHRALVNDSVSVLEMCDHLRQHLFISIFPIHYLITVSQPSDQQLITDPSVELFFSAKASAEQ